MTSGPIRILFVFAWLAVGGEETEVRLLARNLDRRRYRLGVVACFHKEGMPRQTHQQLENLDIEVDTAPYGLEFEDTVAYLARKFENYDLIVATQAVPEVYPALDRMTSPPPLIEHGGLVSEALAGPKHQTARYVGVCRSIRDAAASRMPERPHHAIQIPSMVDLAEFAGHDRAAVRAELGIDLHAPLIGWAGRLDRKKRVEDFIEAAALLSRNRAEARFLVIGGPDAFMPEYERELRFRATTLSLDSILIFVGDRADIPRLISALDIFVWLSRGEGMPHVISEAGAIGVAVIATRDNGSEEQIADEETGLFVPHENPQAVAIAMERLVVDGRLRYRLGQALKRKVEREYSTTAIVRQWEKLFEDLIQEMLGERGLS